MKFAVESWAPEYGSSMEDGGGLATPSQPPDLAVERAIEDWAPVRPSPCVEPATSVLFTDGVRRIDARVWIEDEASGTARLGVCASYGAGLVRARLPQPDESGPGAAGLPGLAQVVAVTIDRGLFTASPAAEPIETCDVTFQVRAACGDGTEQLSLGVQQRMGELEVALAAGIVERDPVDLVVIDGPLRGRQHVTHAIGYVKSHHVAYLPSVVSHVVADLAPGERTPLFLTTTSWSRYSWYLRLPGGAGHPWAGVIRGEASADLSVAAAVELADVSAATLPRFASRPHKDSRAPQNLYPIAGLERILRHRLGDPALIYRSLRAAAA